ncbi:hypothetical protein PRUPE_1G274200 [Prunus persica]|uniref:Uncharacterized protein n=1 Tax=Prunus persica TaxID=3760 RepID=A0A251R442_PRUPE|nr:hypothetical protein PRUPE_1G274200 [Prunus persica]
MVALNVHRPDPIINNASATSRVVQLEKTPVRTYSNNCSKCAGLLQKTLRPGNKPCSLLIGTSLELLREGKPLISPTPFPFIAAAPPLLSLSLSLSLHFSLSATATVIITSTDSLLPSPMDGSDASPVGSPDRASSEIQRQPSDDDVINLLGPAVSPRISNKKLLSRSEHEDKGDFAISPKHFKVAWVKLMTVCIAVLQQQNSAITSIHGL